MNDPSAQRHSEGGGGQGRLIAGAVLGGLAVLFAVLNLDKVLVHWIIVTVYTPLIVVILLSLAVGWILGWLTTRNRRARR
jgi:lipopolysaccharide assembly protein A